jgi:hypothetical protein
MRVNVGLKAYPCAKPEKIILEWTLEIYGMRVWKEFNWMRIESHVGGIHEHGNGPGSGFPSNATLV